jgi:hypothetical protein
MQLPALRDRQPERPRRGRRSAFTLPELLVAAALSMAIMALIAVAFQKAIDIFRNMRAVGSMEDKLRSAENVIKRDLSSEHFGGIFKPGYAGAFLRDQRLDLSGWMPPDEGYFSFRQGTVSFLEGGANDSDGVPSYVSPNPSTNPVIGTPPSPPAATHWLAFTVKLSGRRAEDYFRATNPGNLGPPYSPADFATGGQFVSRWAEVAYFLWPTGQSANGTPLYSLRRRQRVALAPEMLAVASVTTAPPIQNVGQFPDVSVKNVNVRTGTATPNTSADLTVPANRMSLIPLQIAAPQDPLVAGDDILLTNVISFEVKPNWSNGNAASNVAAPVFPAAKALGDWPFPWMTTPIVFDTGTRLNANANINWDDPTSYKTATVSGATTGGTAFTRIRVNAIQIRIRIWDSSTQTARQITIVQDV